MDWEFSSATEHFPSFCETLCSISSTPFIWKRYIKYWYKEFSAKVIILLFHAAIRMLKAGGRRVPEELTQVLRSIKWVYLKRKELCFAFFDTQFHSTGQAELKVWPDCQSPLCTEITDVHPCNQQMKSLVIIWKNSLSEALKAGHLSKPLALHKTLCCAAGPEHPVCSSVS